MDSRYRFLLFVTLIFTLAVPAHADTVATVTFIDVPSDCGFRVGPCPGLTFDETVWTGHFTMDLQTGEIIADDLTSTGLGTGPWTSDVGTFHPDCLPFVEGASHTHFDCYVGWSDAAGWSLTWGPGDFDEGILHSSNHFFSMGEFVTGAPLGDYYVTTPEPPTMLLLGVALVLVWAWRLRDPGFIIHIAPSEAKRLLNGAKV